MSAHRADLDSAAIGELGEVTLATAAGRFGARLIDTTAVGIPAGIAGALVWPREALVASAVLIAVVGIVYETALVATRGSTPGKKLLCLHIVDAKSGAEPGVLAAGLRAMGFWVVPGALGVVAWVLLSFLFGDAFAKFGLAAVVLLAVVSPLFDERRRRGVPDMLAGTVVLLRPQA